MKDFIVFFWPVTFQKWKIVNIQKIKLFSNNFTFSSVQLINDLLRSYNLYNGKIIDKTFNNANRIYNRLGNKYSKGEQVCNPF